MIRRDHNLRGELLVAMLALLLGCEPAGERFAAPRPLDITPPTRNDILASRDRGIAFLLQTQLSDGSWGKSNRRFMYIATRRSSPVDFEMATTAMALQALIESGTDATPEGLDAIERAEAWLLANLPGYRYDGDAEMFNVWGHTYALQAVACILKHRPMTDERRAEWQDLAKLQLHLLARYESLRGGWGYYVVHPYTRPPSHWATSFMTASVLIAMHDAHEMGFDVPRGTIATAMRALSIARSPDGAFTYTVRYLKDPVSEPNRGAGAMARAQSCNLAMYLWDDPRVTDEVFTRWLDRLISRIGWMDMERKKPAAHTGEYQIASYYYYYGLYYAARTIDALPDDQRPFYQGQLAQILIDRQDGDGSWWDFPLYDFFQGYGTAYAVMALNRCLPDAILLEDASNE
jgi:hypothetical protein